METPIKKRVVGIGAVCADAGRAEMVAYAIGSCIALCLYDAVTGVGAMAHILLPGAGVSGHESSAAPDTKYADHALDAALAQMCALGAARCRIEAGIVGGAEMFPLGAVHALNIGERNVASVKEELQKAGIPLRYAVTGGKKSRTVTFKIPGASLRQQIAIRMPQL